MQYITLSNGQYRTFRDSVSGLKFRVGQRDNFYVVDAELVVGGFSSGVEDVTWINVGGNNDDPGNECTGTYIRMGVRGTNWVIDIEITATGFDGTEDVDWKNFRGIDII